MNSADQAPVPPRDPAPRSAEKSSAPADAAWLEAALRDTAREHVDDGGFAARVLAGLPPPAVRRASAWRRHRRAWLVGAAALVGAAGVAFQAGPELGAALGHSGEAVARGLVHGFAAAPWLAQAIGYAFAAAFLGFCGWWAWRRS